MNGKIEKLLNRAKLNENESSISFAEKTFSGEHAAKAAFANVKNRLHDIAEWNKCGLLSSYEIFHENGEPVSDHKLFVSVFLRISLKGSLKYDWVRVIEIDDASENEFVITVKPIFDPTADAPDKTIVSHFFTDAATNNFCLRRRNETLALCVIGLDEHQNAAETGSAFETVRNAAVNFASYLGIQTGEWTKFCRHFIENADGAHDKPQSETL